MVDAWRMHGGAVIVLYSRISSVERPLAGAQRILHTLHDPPGCPTFFTCRSGFAINVHNSPPSIHA